jgi:myo-inositol-1(or 4)-monophosphatase
MNPYLNIAIKAVRQGARQLLQSMDRIDRLTITEKAKHDFVSTADKLSEFAIVEVLQKYYPDISIMSEETGMIDGSDPEYCWVLDPLDGTSNYLRQIPHFSISLALLKHGKTLMAVVYDPVRDELFTAIKGSGAYFNSQRVRVSERQLSSSYIGLGGPKYHTPVHTDTHHAMAVALMANSLSTRRLGSSALDLCYLASGRIDGYWGVFLQEWDIAAASLIVREAGGLITNLSGKPYQKDDDGIIAASPKIIHEIIELCGECSA